MPSVRWGSQRSIPAAGRSPGPKPSRRSSSADSAETGPGQTASRPPRRTTRWSPRPSGPGRSASAARSSPVDDPRSGTPPRGHSSQSLLVRQPDQSDQKIDESEGGRQGENRPIGDLRDERQAQAEPGTVP